MKINIPKEWIIANAHKEEGLSVEAGAPILSSDGAEKGTNMRKATIHWREDLKVYIVEFWQDNRTVGHWPLPTRVEAERAVQDWERQGKRPQ